ncbi:SigE family RNA polymerase sigma factor [Nocardioides sp.]|uniref:SigE family RNA polymerase sigma factor n=1 Tax=Nocardioides sp. TaxID=35761 RepID=UPI003D141227
MEDFEAFVRARSAALLRTAYLLTGDAHRAEDVVQETLIRAADRWSRITPDPEPYVRRILYTRAVDGWRQRRVRDAAAVRLPVPRDASTSPAETVAPRLVLREALLRLTTRQRAVLVLRYYDDLTEQQTAAVLGCSVNTVKSQARHALARLRVLAPELLADLDPMETT